LNHTLYTSFVNIIESTKINLKNVDGNNGFLISDIREYRVSLLENNT